MCAHTRARTRASNGRVLKQGTRVVLGVLFALGLFWEYQNKNGPPHTNDEDHQGIGGGEGPCDF